MPAWRPARGRSASSDNPLLVGFQGIFGAAADPVLIGILALSGQVASFHAGVYAFGRAIFSLARAGYIPRALSLTHRTRKTPHRALIAGALIGYAAALAVRYAPDTRQVAAVLLNMSVFAAVLSYIIQMAAFLALQRNYPGLNRPYRSPLGATGAMTALVIALACLILLFANPAYRPGLLGCVPCCCSRWSISAPMAGDISCWRPRRPSRWNATPRDTRGRAGPRGSGTRSTAPPAGRRPRRIAMASAGMPDSLLEVLGLAGVIIFAITSVSAALSALLVRKENLFYLATQIVLLLLLLHQGARWAYPLWFADLFDDGAQYDRAVLTLLFFALAFAADVGTRILLWRGMLARSGRSAVPPLLVGTVRVLTYLFASLIVIQFVYGKSITALATLSGAFALVLGLSAQTTLGEMFAGIAIALSRPFRLGDWVKVGTLDEGRVVDMTWRLVRIETRDHHTINIPNRMVADASVYNFSHPRRTVRVLETIYLPPLPDGADPGDIEQRLVEAVLQLPRRPRRAAAAGAIPRLPQRVALPAYATSSPTITIATRSRTWSPAA